MDTQKLSSTGIGFVFAFECTPYDEYYNNTSATPSPVSQSSCDNTFLSTQHAQPPATIATHNTSSTTATAKLQHPQQKSVSPQHTQPQPTTATTTNYIGEQQTQHSHKHELTPPTSSSSSSNTFNNSLSPSHITITPLTPLNTPLTTPFSKNTALVSSNTTSAKNQSSKKQSKLKKKKNLIFRGGIQTTSQSNSTKQQPKRVEVSPRYDFQLQWSLFKTDLVYSRQLCVRRTVCLEIDYYKLK